MTGSLQQTDIELWADSFHEGQWACDQLAQLLTEQGGSHSVTYLNGFVPVHLYIHGNWSVEITVYGSYRAWSDLPPKLDELITWGKPDLIAYSASTDQILFAVEESAATPTGNQALQRCERQFGAAFLHVPFWYLLSEFGVHTDGGVRRDSIWPTVMALKLSQDNNLPSIVLHYADITNPEDYSAGTGLRSLFTGLLQLITNVAEHRPPFFGMSEMLTEQYQNMLDFIGRQWPNQIDYLPGAEALAETDLARNYALASSGSEDADAAIWSARFLRWPGTQDLPDQLRTHQTRRPLIKYDAFADRLETDLGRGITYGLSNRSGSRPQPPAQVAHWIGLQKAMFDAAPPLPRPAVFDMELDDFPESRSELLHLTTSRRIVYLYDRWEDVRIALEETFPRLDGYLPTNGADTPALVYISNSLLPGRIFGDPFTGQIAAFSIAFGKLDPIPRKVIAYFPHQCHAQAFAAPANHRNKGLTIMRELTDFLVFGGGVVVQLADRIVL